MNDQRTPNTIWRQNADGSWEPTPLVVGARPGGGGGGTSNGPFLTEFEVIGGDNITIVHNGDGSITLREGGHIISEGGVDTPFRTRLNFSGGVSVVDDAANNRTNVIVDAGGSAGTLVWRGPYDAGAVYSPGDVVSSGDGLFVFTAGTTGFGFGEGPFGDGAFGGESSGGGLFGSPPFGEGPFGG